MTYSKTIFGWKTIRNHPGSSKCKAFSALLHGREFRADYIPSSSSLLIVLRCRCSGAASYCLENCRELLVCYIAVIPRTKRPTIAPRQARIDSYS
jgi:hypothetical protein